MNHTQNPAAAPQRVISPDVVKTRLLVHMGVYSRAVAALLLTDPAVVRKLWRELTPDMSGREDTTHLNKIQAVASALADGSACEVESFLEDLLRRV